MDYPKLCRLIHESTAIPVYLYEQKALRARFPNRAQAFDPPADICSRFAASSASVTHFTTVINSLYGCCKLEDDSVWVIIGPVKIVPYTQDEILSLMRQYQIDSGLQNHYQAFLLGIPVLHERMFYSNLLLVNQLLRGELLSVEKYLRDEIGYENNPVYKPFTLAEASLRDQGPLVDETYEYSETIYQCVQNGDLKSLQDRAEISFEYAHNRSVYSNDALRQQKTIMIINATEMARAAIRGGLPVQTAVLLRSAYIKACDTLTDLSAVNSLIQQVFYDFTTRVAELRHPSGLTQPVRKAIDYIAKNMNKPLDTQEIANHVGVSRSYLSKRFKAETGILLNHYIIVSKMDQAKLLLKNTDWPLSKISNYLGFSSQSYFQKCFKEACGITPSRYRTTKLEPEE